MTKEELKKNLEAEWIATLDTTVGDYNELATWTCCQELGRNLIERAVEEALRLKA